MACACNDVGCVAEVTGADAMVGGVAIVADERLEVDSNHAVAASAGVSVVVSGVLTEGEDGY